VIKKLFLRKNKMDRPCQDFWYDGNYGCLLTDEECEGLPCGIADEYVEYPDEEVSLND
jgi:hypothetical protein